MPREKEDLSSLQHPILPFLKAHPSTALDFILSMTEWGELCEIFVCYSKVIDAIKASVLQTGGGRNSSRRGHCPHEDGETSMLKSIVVDW